MGIPAHLRSDLAQAVEDLQVSLDDRKRRAQLMGGVAQELLLFPEGAFHSVKHFIEGGDQVSDLIGGTPVVDAGAGLLLGEASGGLGDHLDRPKDAAEKEPAPRSRSQEGHQPESPEEIGELA